MTFFKRTRQIQERIQNYLDGAADVIECYQRSLDYYFGRGITPHFQALVDEIHAKESQADDLRRNIEIELYKRSLLPELREDIFRLLEVVDQIPNHCEDILRQILTQSLDIPANLHGEIRELAQIANIMMNLIRDGVKEVLNGNRQVQDITSQIDQQESVGDRLQQSAIQKLFQMDLDLAEKLLYRSIINEIGSVCDLADDVGIALDILSVKRNV